MLSSRARLVSRTPAGAAARVDYLEQLLDEFLHTATQDAKYQVLANLANFAYDPINYEYMRDIGVLDVFLHVLKQESDVTLLHYASTAVCNLCPDPVNADYIFQNGGLHSIIKLLSSSTHIETLTNTIATLIYLCSPQTRSIITADNVVQAIAKLQKSNDKRLANMATIFLTDIAQQGGLHFAAETA